jgi:hypothetical protein
MRCQYLRRECGSGKIGSERVLKSHAVRGSEGHPTSQRIACQATIGHCYRRFQPMERTERAGITNFLEREEVTCAPQASPSFFPPQHTRCSTRWEILLSNHGSSSTVTRMCMDTSWRKSRRKGRLTLGRVYVLSHADRPAANRRFDNLPLPMEPPTNTDVRWPTP